MSTGTLTWDNDINNKTVALWRACPCQLTWKSSLFKPRSQAVGTVLKVLSQMRKLRLGLQVPIWPTWPTSGRTGTVTGARAGGGQAGGAQGAPRWAGRPGGPPTEHSLLLHRFTVGPMEIPRERGRNREQSSRGRGTKSEPGARVPEPLTGGPGYGEAALSPLLPLSPRTVRGRSCMPPGMGLGSPQVSGPRRACLQPCLPGTECTLRTPLPSGWTPEGLSAGAVLSLFIPRQTP